MSLSKQIYNIYYNSGEEGCHLRVVPPGQLLRRPSTPKPFIEPGFSIFFDVKFFCVCFPLVKGFSLRLLCLFSNSCQFKFFIYSLYIHIYIFYIFFHCTHCRSTHNSSTMFFCVFAVVSLWHPGVGRDVRKKPLPYNYFFTSLF